MRNYEKRLDAKQKKKKQQQQIYLYDCKLYVPVLEKPNNKRITILTNYVVLTWNE